LFIPPQFHRTSDLHVHVPEGAIPKDGPSAGIAMATSMLSALRGQAPAASLSMTGEITLLGRVLPIGGVKEKLLAAHRAGIRIVILPKDNEKDLVEIPSQVRDDLKIVLVEKVEEVFALAFPD
jgi:ATP-dependent Lon protease